MTVRQTIGAAMTDMAARCTSCGECVRPCSFLQQNGTPAVCANTGATDQNLLKAFHCSLCGLCDGLCPEGLTPSELFHTMRQEAVARGLLNLKPYHPWLTYEKLGRHPLFQRYLIPVGCNTVFFPGCSLPGTRPDAVRGLYRLLQKQDMSIGLVLDCCGKISHDLGLTERFNGIFGQLASRLQRHTITRIVTACPGCSKILRHYREDFEVVSIYEVLAQLPAGAPRPLHSDPVVIHDPCPARFDHSQQLAVRQLIQSSGYRIEELPDHGRTTRCCGQGGMVEGCLPGTVKSEARVIAAESAGRPVISSCAACCETLAPTTPTAHIADLVTGTGSFTSRPVSSLKRWLNRLKLRFSRFS